LVEENILPNSHLWEGLGLIVFGIVLVYVLEKLSQKK